MTDSPGVRTTRNGRTVVTGNRWDLVPAGPLRPVSVVIPYYEAPEDLRRLLASLRVQTAPVHDIVVVDDGSRHHPARDVVNRVVEEPTGRSPVTVLTQPDRGIRPAAARNLGCRGATGEVVVFLDGDVVAHPDLIARIAALPSVLPDAVVVGHRRHADLGGMDGARACAVAADERLAGAEDLGEPGWLSDGYAATNDLLDLDVRSWRYVISAALAVERRTFLDLGGFDEDIVGYGGEDWEFAHRALHRGAVLVHAPDAVVVHNGPDLAGRGELAAKDQETLRLLPLISDRTFRPPGIRGRTSRVLVRVHDEGWTDAMTARCVAATLATWPDCHVQLTCRRPAVEGLDDRIGTAPASTATAPAVGPHVEVVVDVHAPVDVSGLAEDLLAAVDPGGLDALHVEGAGDRWLTVAAARTLLRLDRATDDPDERRELWRDLATVDVVEAAAVGLQPLTAGGTLEHHLDGGAPAPSRRTATTRGR